MYQIIAEYLEYLELEKGLSENTIQAYRRDLSDFCAAENIEDIHTITRLTINSYIRQLREKKLAPTSVIRKIASIRGFFKWACSTGILNKNPASTLEQPKIPQRLPKVVSVKEIEKGFEEIGAVVENNSAAAEETSATSQELSAQASALKGLVEQFRLREN